MNINYQQNKNSNCFVRRSYNDGTSWRCTVKFMGTIPQWAHETALGVEWDDPIRGRNDGEIDGVRYFECRVPGSGSFLKASRTPEGSITFDEAVGMKYLDNSKFEEIKLSDKKAVETVWSEKIRKRQSNTDSLNSISVENCLVSSFDLNSNYSFNNLERIDLSNNLISDFKELSSFLSRLGKLKSVKLNGNRFNFNTLDYRQMDAENNPCSCTQVLELEMANTLITEAEIRIVSKLFPKLKEFSLAQNRLSYIPEYLPASLSVLDLAYNPIHELHHIPLAVESVYLSNTAVAGIPEAGADHIPKKVDLRGTPIANNVLSWDNISRLGDYGVIELQLHDTRHLDEAMKIRPYIITRCPKLVKLDGNLINSTERFDAGLYTLHSVVSKKHPLLPPQIWEALIALHGMPPVAPSKSIQARLISFYVDNDNTPMRIVKDAPISRLHWLVSRSKNTTPRMLHIKGITDLPKVENDALANLREVGDFLSNGQHIITYNIQ